MGLIGLALLGESLWRMVNIPEPAWYTQNIKENKFRTVMMAFFLGNMLTQNIISTRAFEVEFNGQPVWSALERGGVPSIEFLLEQLGEAGAAR